MRNWTWIGASCRGQSHLNSGVRLQDSSSSNVTGHDAQVFLSVVSDGAGTAKFGGQGASLICRIIAQSANRHFSSGSNLPRDDEILEWVEKARQAIQLASAKRDLTPRDFAATMIFAASDGLSTVVAKIGDGGAVLRDPSDSTWVSTIWPDHGEFASTTYFLTDECQPRLRICRVLWPISGLAVFTDGLERLVLDFARKEPHQAFFDAIVRPLEDSICVRRRDRQLSRHLVSFLESEKVNQRTDDDKTLVVAIIK